MKNTVPELWNQYSKMTELNTKLYQSERYADLSGYSKQYEKFKVAIFKQNSEYIISFNNGVLLYIRFTDRGWTAELYFHVVININELRDILNQVLSFIHTNCGINVIDIYFQLQPQILIDKLPVGPHHAMYIMIMIDYLREKQHSILHQLGFQIPGDGDIEFIYLMSTEYQTLSKYIQFPTYSNSLHSYLISPNVQMNKIISIFDYRYICNEEQDYCDDFFNKKLISEGVRRLNHLQLQI